MKIPVIAWIGWVIYVHLLSGVALLLYRGSATGRGGPSPVVVAFDPAGPTALAGDPGVARLRVVVDRASAEDLAIRYRAVDGSATRGRDYGPGPGTTTLRAGDVEATVEVEILRDPGRVAPRDFAVELEGSAGVAVKPSGSRQVVLIPGEQRTPPPTEILVEFTSGRSEAREGAGSVSLPLRLTPSPSKRIEVPYRVRPDGATSTASIAVGGPPRIDLPIPDDSAHEPDRELEVELLPAPGLRLGANRRMALKVIDDDEPPVLTITSVRAEAAEGSGRPLALRASLGRPSRSAVTFKCRVAPDGDARPGLDFTPPPPTFTIPAGARGLDIEVPVVDDKTPEPPRSLYLEFSDVRNASLGGAARFRLSIADDDASGGTVLVVLFQTDELERMLAGVRDELARLMKEPTNAGKFVGDDVVLIRKGAGPLSWSPARAGPIDWEQSFNQNDSMKEMFTQAFQEVARREAAAKVKDFLVLFIWPNKTPVNQLGLAGSGLRVPEGHKTFLVAIGTPIDDSDDLEKLVGENHARFPENERDLKSILNSIILFQAPPGG